MKPGRPNTAGLLLATGVLLVLTGLLTMPASAWGWDGTLQPSPRPPWYATTTPLLQPSETPVPSFPTPVLTPTPARFLLPASGGTLAGGWLVAAGAALVLLGLTVAVFSRRT